MAWVEAYFQRNCVYRGVVIACVVEYEVANTLSVYTELFQRLDNNLCYPMSTVGACQLRQRDR